MIRKEMLEGYKNTLKGLKIHHGKCSKCGRTTKIFQTRWFTGKTLPSVVKPSFAEYCLVCDKKKIDGLKQEE